MDIDKLLLTWKSRDAASYAQRMFVVHGKPDEVGTNMMEWANVDGLVRVRIRDESTPHSFPMPHIDFIYSSRSLAVPADTVGRLASVSGSIAVDGLKGEVWARCGTLLKNAVTLGFVEDVVAGRADPTKEEYMRRIMSDQAPNWYLDRMGEREAPMRFVLPT
jgi:hypothetical protein